MYKRGFFDQAISPLNKSLELEQDNIWAHNLLGIILWEKGIRDQSLEKLKGAIALDRNNIAVQLNYAVLLIEQGNYEEAENLLKTLPPTEGDLVVKSHYLLGLVYQKTNRDGKALEELDKAYTIVKENSPVAIDESITPFYSLKVSILHDIAEIYKKRGDSKKALEFLHEAFHEGLIIETTPEREHLEEIRDLMIYE
jgi:tetratricopeptide (TPR) repeat protein